MIVVDANVISYLLIRGERSGAMDRLQKLDPDWIAPKLWLDEFLNVLCTYERTGALTPEQSVELLEDAVALMDDASYDLPPERVLTVARQTNCSAYDSQYIALAQDLGLKLYTCDKRVISKCPGVALMPD